MHICEEEVIFLAAYFTISVTKMFANKSHLPNASQKELLTKQASVSQTMHENTWKCTIYFGIIRSVGQIKRLRPQSSRTISSEKGKNLFSKYEVNNIKIFINTNCSIPLYNLYVLQPVVTNMKVDNSVNMKWKSVECVFLLVSNL